MGRAVGEMDSVVQQRGMSDGGKSVRPRRRSMGRDGGLETGEPIPDGQGQLLRQQ